jgi:hypothetical protein
LYQNVEHTSHETRKSNLSSSKSNFHDQRQGFVPGKRHKYCVSGFICHHYGLGGRMSPIQKTFHTTEAMELVLLTGGDIYPTPVHIMAIKHFRHFTRPY